MTGGLNSGFRPSLFRKTPYGAVVRPQRTLCFADACVVRPRAQPKHRNVPHRQEGVLNTASRARLTRRLVHRGAHHRPRFSCDKTILPRMSRMRLIPPSTVLPTPQHLTVNRK